MNIESIKKLKLDEGDVLVIEVDTGSLPPNRVSQMMSELKESVRNLLGEVPLMVLPMHKVRLSTLNVQDAVVKSHA